VIPPLGAQRVDALFEKAFVIHCELRPRITAVVTWAQSELRNATRSPFCCSVNPMPKRWL
jgi:hypothetical protein